MSNIVIAAGAWSPHAFSSAFPNAQFVPAITSLAGFSMVVSSPLSPFFGKTQTTDELNSRTSSSAIAEDGVNTDISDVSSLTSRSTVSGVQIECHSDSIDFSPIRQALFVRSSIYSRWSPEIFSRSNGEIYIAGLNEQGYHTLRVARGSMAPLHMVGPADDYQSESATEDSSDNESDNAAKRPGVDKFKTLDEVARSLLGPEITVIKRSVCLRPITPRGEPIIGEVPSELVGGARGVYICSGHGPWGISLCLGSGKVISEMITEGYARSADVSRLAPI